MTIFVSIAAYRDPELLPTIANCIARARWPEELRFGICWQHGEGEPRPPDLGSRRMRVIDVPWQQSQGACWARSQCMALYDGEDHFLQLDSHHRFAQDWDAVLLDQAERSGSARPILSTYAAGFDPKGPEPKDGAPTVMRLDRFTPEGIALFLFGTMPGWEAREAPMRARFVSGHLLFAPGSFVADVPYDPELYFIGEEITLAIRAFTHGYDLFHPARHIVWHEYTRKARPKHWDDHVASRGVATPWHTRDAASLARARSFLSNPQPGRFGCGTARSFAEYEAYSGIRFHRRFASRAARRGEEPAPPSWHAPRQTWHVRFGLDRAQLAPAALDNPLFWYVGFHDAEGAEIARDDAGRPEIARLLGQGGRIEIERRFAATRPPVSCTVWPTDARGRWLERIDQPVEPVLSLEAAE